jgi:phthiodiolone/phenolphthiodiolone dimycocerosates ketoreductase
MVSRSRISVGLQLGTQPPLGATTALAWYARLIGLRSLMAIDHFQNIFPTAIWDEEFSWLAARRRTPHEHFDYQALLGYLAGRVGNVRLGVGVTEPIRRHPVLIAQTMLTLAHMTRQAPILGIGAGERMNVDPYGLDFAEPVGRLAEALQIIRLCFSRRGPIDFEGRHFTLDGALMDLEPPPGRTPAIWVAGHGPRMLDLTGTYGDGWYPTMTVSPDEYADKLRTIRGAARAAGRDPQAITPALHRFVVVAPSDREAEALLDHKAIRSFGLAAPAELWRRVGARHPFGERFRGYVDLVPERYDRHTIEEAIAAVPPELAAEGPLLWGTPEQVAGKLRAFEEAGLRHVVLAPLSGLVSRSAAVYSLRAVRTIARALSRRGQT